MLRTLPDETLTPLFRIALATPPALTEERA